MVLLAKMAAQYRALRAHYRTVHLFFVMLPELWYCADERRRHSLPPTVLVASKKAYHAHTDRPINTRRDLGLGQAIGVILFLSYYKDYKIGQSPKKGTPWANIPEQGRRSDPPPRKAVRVLYGHLIGRLTFLPFSGAKLKGVPLLSNSG